MTPVGFEPMASRLLVQPCIHMTTSARWSIDANIDGNPSIDPPPPIWGGLYIILSKQFRPSTT